MSTYRTFKGTLTKVNLQNTNQKDFAKNEMNILGYYHIPPIYENWLEFLISELHDEYILLDNNLYKMEYKECDIPENCILTKINDDVIDFFTTFYDGTTWLGEVLTDAYNRENEH